MKHFLRAISYFRPDLRSILLSLLLVGLSVIANVAWPLPITILIDVVLTHQQIRYWPYQVFERFAPPEPVSQIVLLAVLVLIIRVMGEVLRMVQTMVSIRIGYSGLARV